MYLMEERTVDVYDVINLSIRQTTPGIIRLVYQRFGGCDNTQSNKRVNNVPVIKIKPNITRPFYDMIKFLCQSYNITLIQN